MPPQFFKDASSGKNNKFIPRFSLNLGATETSSNDSNDSLDNKDVSSSEISQDSPLSVSTAPSTGVSSKFFLNSSNQKTCVGAKRFMVTTPSNTKEMLSEIKNSDQDVDTDADDDDIQITQVRNIPEEKDRQTPNQEMLSYEETNSKVSSHQNYSSDFLLEALAKSQGICDQLRKKLAETISRSKNQEDELTELHKNKEVMKETFKKFKLNLMSLEQNSSEVNQARKQDFNTLKSLKNDYHSVTSSMEILKGQTSNLKKKIDHLQQLKLSTKYEIDKRKKEITQLQKQLDQTSGTLSEQKIKNLELERSLEASRNNYDKNIGELFDKFSSISNSVLVKIDESNGICETFLKDNLKSSVDPLSEKLDSSFSSKIDSLAESLAKSFTLNETVLSAKLDSSMKILTGNQNKLEILDKSWTEYFSSSKISSTNIDAELVSINGLVKSLLESVEKDNNKSSEVLEISSTIKLELDKLDKDIKQQDMARIKIEEIENVKEVLKAEFEKSKIKNLELEKHIIKLKEEVDAFKTSTVVIKEATESKNGEIKALETQIGSKEKALNDMDKKFNQYKVTSESKIKTQINVCKIISEELENIKKQHVEEKKDLKRIIKDGEDKIENVIEQNNNLKMSTNNLEAQKQSLEETIESLKRTNHSLEEKVTELASKCNDALNMGNSSVINNNRDDIEVLSTQTASKEGENHSPQKITPITNRSRKTNKVFRKVDISRNVVKPKPSTSLRIPAVSGKSLPLSKKHANVISEKNTSIIPKRKTLLDDDDFQGSFDDFDFDNVVTIQPKRYTKRKKTTT